MLFKYHRNGKIYIKSPYSKKLIAQAKTRGGTWDANAKLWVFPEMASDVVDKICVSVFGVRPLGLGGRTVDIKITARENLEQERGPVEFSGFPIVAAEDRDSGATPMANVTLLDGEHASGGSRQYWKTIVKAGAEYLVEGMHPEAKDKNWDVEIVRGAGGKPVVRVAATNDVSSRNSLFVACQKLCGLSQTDLAQYLSTQLGREVSPHTIRDFVRGQSTVRDEHYDALRELWQSIEAAAHDGVIDGLSDEAINVVQALVHLRQPTVNSEHQ